MLVEPGYSPGEDTHTLRLTSSLVEFRVGYANPLLRLRSGTESERTGSAVKTKRTLTRSVLFVLYRGYEKIFFVDCIKVSNPSKINTFRPKGEKLHQHLFTIHYYLLLAKNRQRDFSEK